LSPILLPAAVPPLDAMPLVPVTENEAAQILGMPIILALDVLARGMIEVANTVHSIIPNRHQPV